MLEAINLNLSHNTTITLDGSGSSGRDGASIVSYHWDFGGTGRWSIPTPFPITTTNSTTDIITPVSSFGIFWADLELRVTDSNGRTNTDRVCISMTSSC